MYVYIYIYIYKMRKDNLFQKFEWGGVFIKKDVILKEI